MEKEENIIAITKFILMKLIRMDKWGGAHTSARNLTRGLPSRYLVTSQGKKMIHQAIKELNNKQFLIVKLSTGEIHVSLNPGKSKEIKEFLQEN